MTRRWTLAGALSRARYHRSRWRIVAIPVGVVCIGAVIAVLVDIGATARMLLAPGAAFFCAPTRAAVIGEVLAIGGFSVPIGLMLANTLLWTIPPIRATFERETASTGASFAVANRALARLSLISFVVLLPVYFWALSASVCVSIDAIYFRPSLLAGMERRGLTEVAAVRPWCERGGRGGWDIGLEVVLTNGDVFDLATVPRFAASADRILAALHAAPVDLAKIAPGCPPGLVRILVRHAPKGEST